MGTAFRQCSHELFFDGRGERKFFVAVVCLYDWIGSCLVKGKACCLFSRRWRTDGRAAIGTRAVGAVATEVFALEVLAILMTLKVFAIMNF